MKRITPCLWFDDQAEQAANFYVSVFPNSRITATSHYGTAGPRPEGMVMTVDFELNGNPFMALNGGPEFKFSEAVSFVIRCKDQAEIDSYWSKLGAGGKEIECGWIRDKFGLSWQVVPELIEKVMADPDQAKVDRVMKEVLTMVKLDVARLQRAYDGATTS